MNLLKIALLQISPRKTLEENLEKGIRACREAKKKGAEIALFPNACPMEINRLSQLRARSYENMTAIATCSYPETVPDCNGCSSVFDGIAYLPELENSRDTCILQADGTEEVFLATLDLDMLRKYRQTEVHGNAYRHPQKYGLLVCSEKKEPFIRADYRE